VDPSLSHPHPHAPLTKPPPILREMPVGGTREPPRGRSGCPGPTHQRKREGPSLRVLRQRSPFVFCKMQETLAIGCYGHISTVSTYHAYKREGLRPYRACSLQSLYTFHRYESQVPFLTATNCGIALRLPTKNPDSLAMHLHEWNSVRTALS